jgi:hypothetical protein
MSKENQILPPKYDIEVDIPKQTNVPDIKNMDEELENILKTKFHIYNPNQKKEIKHYDAEDYKQMDKATVAPKRASLLKICEEYRDFWVK